MAVDGDSVTYSGPEVRGVCWGDQGVVLTMGHVLWRTGGRRGEVELVDPAYLTSLTDGPGLLADTLDAPPRQVAVREVYETQGEAGLLAALGEAGSLSELPQIAEDVIALASARVRTGLASVLTQLDPEDVDTVVGIVTTACVREALGA